LENIQHSTLNIQRPSEEGAKTKRFPTASDAYRRLPTLNGKFF